MIVRFSVFIIHQSTLTFSRVVHGGNINMGASSGTLAAFSGLLLSFIQAVI